MHTHMYVYEMYTVMLNIYIYWGAHLEIILAFCCLEYFIAIL